MFDFEPQAMTPIVDYLPAELGFQQGGKLMFADQPEADGDEIVVTALARLFNNLDSGAGWGLGAGNSSG